MCILDYLSFYDHSECTICHCIVRATFVVKASTSSIPAQTHSAEDNRRNEDPHTHTPTIRNVCMWITILIWCRSLCRGVR